MTPLSFFIVLSVTVILVDGQSMVLTHNYSAGNFRGSRYATNPKLKQERANVNIENNLSGWFNQQTVNINTYLQDTEDSMQAGAGQSQSVADSTIRKQEQILQDIIEQLKLLLLMPQREGDKLGIDVSNCVGGKLDKANYISKQVAEAIKKCVQAQIRKIKQYIAEQMIGVDRCKPKIDGIIQEHDKCRTIKENNKKLNCLETLKERADKLIHEVSREVVKLKSLVQEYVINFEKYYLDSCARDKINDVSLKVETLVMQVNLCININHPQVASRYRKGVSSCSFLTKSSLLIIVIMICVHLVFTFSE